MGIVMACDVLGSTGILQRTACDTLQPFPSLGHELLLKENHKARYLMLRGSETVDGAASKFRHLGPQPHHPIKVARTKACIFPTNAIYDVAHHITKSRFLKQHIYLRSSTGCK